jgi:hypothetical protein
VALESHHRYFDECYGDNAKWSGISSQIFGTAGWYNTKKQKTNLMMLLLLIKRCLLWGTGVCVWSVP